MMEGKYLLSKNDFSSSMKKTYKSLLNDTYFTDVTLACGNNKWVRAHKVILSGSSSFFRNLLVGNPHQHPLVYLKGVEMKNLQAVIQFIYLGETTVEKDMVTSFLETARELQVEGQTNESYEENSTEQEKAGIDSTVDNVYSITCNPKDLTNPSLKGDISFPPVTNIAPD